LCDQQHATKYFGSEMEKEALKMNTERSLTSIFGIQHIH